MAPVAGPTATAPAWGPRATTATRHHPPPRGPSGRETEASAPAGAAAPRARAAAPKSPPRGRPRVPPAGRPSGGVGGGAAAGDGGGAAGRWTASTAWDKAKPGTCSLRSYHPPVTAMLQSLLL